MNIMLDTAKWVKDTVKKHNEWFERSIPMIASENVISPMAKEVYMSDFMDRYAEGHPGDRYYHGNIYVDEVELKCSELARKLFKCEWADVRPTSGTVANIAVLKAFSKPGDTISTVALASGAHISTAKFGAVGVRGLNRVEYPFNYDDMNIDVDGAIKTIKEAEPKICLFGQSVYLFPSPIKEIMPAIEEVGATVWYDGAHVLGLVAGGQFQDPLREGVDVISASTHKTLPGPQHGIVLANPRGEDDKAREKWRRKLDSGVFPGVTSNHHLHAMAALTVSLAEHIEFGQDYAAQVVKNAQALGQALYERGFKVFCPHLGFTKSHALAIDVTDIGGGADVAQKLEDANIITNMNMLPWDKKPKSPSGVRVGAQEMTRIGMKESEMKALSEIWENLLLKDRPIEKIKEDVWELKKNFLTVKYCFGEEKPAYSFHKLFE